MSKLQFILVEESWCQEHRTALHNASSQEGRGMVGVVRERSLLVTMPQFKTTAPGMVLPTLTICSWGLVIIAPPADYTESDFFYSNGTKLTD